MRGFGIARAGLAADVQRSEAASHNLANIATPGYQRRVLATGNFNDVLIHRLEAGAAGPAVLGTLGAGPQTVAAQDPALPDAAGANVDAAQEMVTLMTAVRTFEAMQRAVLVQDEAIRKTATEIGKA